MQSTRPAQGCRVSSGQQQCRCQRNALPPSAPPQHPQLSQLSWLTSQPHPQLHDSGLSPISPFLSQVKVWWRGRCVGPWSYPLQSLASPSTVALLDYLCSLPLSLPHSHWLTRTHPLSTPNTHTSVVPTHTLSLKLHYMYLGPGHSGQDWLVSTILGLSPEKAAQGGGGVEENRPLSNRSQTPGCITCGWR